MASEFHLDAVNIPGTKKTFCKNKARGKHTLHKVTQYKKGNGNQLEDYGVLNESLRSKSNSRGLHMPLVCPDGAVVTYACKRQLAGQAGASAVDRTSSAFEVSQASPMQIAALKGLAAHFDESHSRTRHCVLQTGPDSDAFQRYSNLCALNVTPTLEGPSFDVQGSPSGRAKRVAQLVFLNMIFLSRC
nr:mediator of RNA polymerase II transcription subunit 27 [Tanacetum cinerariifolium]